LLGLEQAQLILSGYPNPCTERLEAHGWKRVDLTQRRISRVRTGDGGGSAPESVWLNHAPHGRLFSADWELASAA